MGLRNFFLLLFGFFWLTSLLLPPEGAAHFGDFIPIVSAWFLFFFIVPFLGDRNRPFTKISTKEIIDPSPVTTPKKRRSVWSDRWVFLLFLWGGLSYLMEILTHSGNPPYAAGMFWTFSSIVGIYFLIRFAGSLNAPFLEKILLAGLFAGLLMESGLALNQYFVTNPELRREFLENPEKLLQENALHYEKGSPEYLLLEKRVLDSSEPIGSYGLANTLAGFLVIVLPLLAAPLLSPSPTGPSRRLRIAPLLAIYLVPALWVLLLTKSRTGYLALFAGILGVLAVRFWKWDRSGKKIPEMAESRKSRGRFLTGLVVTTILFALTAGIALKTGVLDSEVFTEAKKSLGYRFDYWVASGKMIADHPLFGVGPGNFQSVYSRYILPTAGETIADPHHFAFELAAVFGLPALLFFLAFLLSLLPSAFSRSEGGDFRTKGFRFPHALFLVAGGLLLFFLFDLSTSAPTDLEFLILAFFPITLFAGFTLPILLKSDFPSPLLGVAMITGLINLSAAGGILYPATAFPIFGLAAILMNRRDGGLRLLPPETDRNPGPTSHRHLPPSLFSSLIVALSILFLTTAFLPHLAERKTIATLERHPEKRNEILTNAFPEAARHSIDLNLARYRLLLDSFAQSPTPENRTRWESARDALLAIAPSSAPIRNEMGTAEFEAFQKTGRSELLEKAIDVLTESVALFPTNAVYHARLALALHAAGESEKATSELTKARSLDESTPHQDRKIPDDLRKELDRIKPR